MGLEARCSATWPGGSGQVKALLEAHELILRGDLRRAIPLGSIDRVVVDGDDLKVQTETEELSLELGSGQAERWRKKISTPAPSLAQKLGVGPSSLAFVIGQVCVSELQAALSGAKAAFAADATLILAVVLEPSDLQEALEAHRGMPHKSPIWIAHQKGKLAKVGERFIRETMRSAGFIDRKVTGVSNTLSAIRFHWRQ